VACHLSSNILGHSFFIEESGVFIIRAFDTFAQPIAQEMHYIDEQRYLLFFKVRHKAPNLLNKG
jgi:hypothetical protein